MALDASLCWPLVKRGTAFSDIWLHLSSALTVLERAAFFQSRMTEEKSATADPSDSSGGEVQKRLTPREYAKAKAMWASGDYSVREISEAVGVTETALRRRFKRDGIERGQNAKKVAAAVHRSIEKTAASQAEELASYAHEIKMVALKFNELMIKKAQADVVKSIRDSTPIGDRLNDFKAMSEASKVVNLNYATAASILGFDKEVPDAQELPEIQIKIMTEEDVKEIREQQRREAAEARGEFDELEDGELSDEELENLDSILEGGDDDIVVEGDDE